MRTHETVDIALAELKLHGIKGQTRDLGSGHIEIAWQVVPEKEVRKVVTAKTASDWRAGLNIRSTVRGLLRADNVEIRRQPQIGKKKPAALQKALDLPRPDVPTTPEQLTAIRGELADLTQLTLRLAKHIGQLREAVLPKAATPAPAHRPEIKLPSRSIKLAEYLNAVSSVSIASLVRDTGLDLKQIKLKLAYLERQGRVVVHQNMAKLKPASPPPVVAKSKTATKANAPRKRHANGKLNGHHAVQ
jgi:hypothetical protein